MKYVFILQHSYELDDCENVKMIGAYSSEKNALDAIQRLKTKPGFADYPEDCFVIDKYLVDEDNWTDGFVTV